MEIQKILKISEKSGNFEKLPGKFEILGKIREKSENFVILH